MKRLLSLLFALPLVLVACDSGTELDLPSPGVLVGNQGNFSDGDGSVTAYDPETEGSAEAVTDLGTIVQSIANDGMRLYVASNTAGRVDVYAFGTDDSLGEEPVARIPVENPRYLAFFENEAFVTSQLYYDRPSEVVVVDRTTFEILETVEVDGFAEDIVAINGRVFVATGAFGASQEVVVIDAASRAVVQRIDVGCAAPRQLEVDGDGEVWVFCAGLPATETADEIEGEIVILDAATGDVVERLEVDGRLDTAGPGQTAFASAETVLAVLNEDTVLRYDAASNDLVATIPVSGDPIGAIAYDRVSERIYLGRVAGFAVAGSVTIHELDGTEISAFAAGVAPTSILFR